MDEISFTDRKRIVDANYVRDFGWRVLSGDDSPLATLTGWQSAEMFWGSYVVTPVAGHEKTLTAEFWYPDCHRLQSLEFPEIVVNVFGHFDAETSRATLRCGYAKVAFTWLERLRSPAWFFNHWRKHGVVL